MQVENAGCRQDRGNDAHCFLRVVAAMAQRIGRRREQLPPAKSFVDLGRRSAVKDPIDRYHQNESQGESNYRRSNNKNERLNPAFGFQQTAKAPVGSNRGAAVTANKRVRTGSRQPEIPRHQVPADRSHQPGA